MLKSELYSRKYYLEKLLEECNRNFRKGKESDRLIVTVNRGRYEYWLRKKGEEKRIYMSQRNMDKVRKMVNNEYRKKVAIQAKKELRMIDQMLRFYEKSKAEDVYYGMHRARQVLVEPIWLSDEEYVRQWMNKEYMTKGVPEDMDSFITKRGERVRSKSEVLIANALNDANIPYRYEEAIKVGKCVYHPDFTCLNVRMRKTIYWEHLGKMGDEQYADLNASKISKYMSAGFFLGDKLICTMETMNCALGTKTIENTIRNYLL